MSKDKDVVDELIATLERMMTTIELLSTQASNTNVLMDSLRKRIEALEGEVEEEDFT